MIVAKSKNTFIFEVEQAAVKVFEHLFVRKFEAALALSNKFISHKHPVFLFALSIKFLIEGDNLSFKEQFNEIEKLPTVGHVDYHNFAIFFEKFNMIQNAMDCLSMAIKLKNDFAPAYVSFGDIFYNRGQMEGAFSAYSSSYECDSKNIPFACKAGHCLELLGLFDREVTYYQKLYNQNPLESQFRICFSKCLLKLGYETQAKEVILLNIDRASDKKLDYEFLEQIKKVFLLKIKKQGGQP